jgi:molecular chaperone DnaJ
MPADYYDLLSVTRDADEKTIKRAYRKAAMECHPDRNPGDAAAEARFKEVSEAYSVLSDAEKRQVYDRYGHDGLKGQGFSGFSDLGDIFSNFGDLFGDLFGFGGGRRRAARGADLRTDMEVTLEDCLHGASREVQIPRRVHCDPCEGSGAKPGTRPSQCATCGGRGQVAVNRGFITMAATCPRCRGAGEHIESPCPECKGQGTQREVEKVTIKVPPGIDQGMKLRVTGKGERAPQGGVPGDLYVRMIVAEHPRFERHGAELIGELSVSMVDACLGADVELETLDDTIRVPVPPGTQPGEIIRMDALGLPYIDGTPGRASLHLRVGVRIPTDLDEDERAALERLRARRA